MVVCRFFKEGYCRYGERCRYEHSYQSKYSYHAPSSPSVQQIAVQSSGQNLTQQQAAAVAVDVGSSVIGKQWLLSSYGPFPFKKSIPGLQDVSPEEVRLAMYDAKANNTGEQAITAYNSMVLDAKAKYNKLIDLGPSVMNTLSKIYNSEAAQSPFGVQSSSQSVFGGQNNTTVFGGKNSSTFSSQSSTLSKPSVYGSSVITPQSIFGGKASAQSAQSVFSGQNSASNTYSGQSSITNVFGGQTDASNIFGGQTNASNDFGRQTNSSNTFGTQSNASNAFGGPTSASNIFDSQNTRAESTFRDQTKAVNVFNSQVSSAQSIFGGNQTPTSSFSPNTFPQSNSQMVIGSKDISSGVASIEPNKAQNIFSSAASPTMFVSPQKVETACQSAFSSPNTTNVFAQIPQTEFNQIQSAHSSFGQIQTPFGTPLPSNVLYTQPNQGPFEATQSSFNSNASAEGDFYSTLTELSPEDLEQYKADSFEFGLIPELPPPQELCF